MGLRVLILHPEVSAIDCRDCAAHVYDVHPRGRWPVKPMMRGGEKIPRIPGTVPPCCFCPKIPDGEQPEPANAVILSDRNVRVVLFDRQCQAVMRWPQDAIVTRNAAIIRGVERALTERRVVGLIEGIAARLGVVSR